MKHNCLLLDKFNPLTISKIVRTNVYRADKWKLKNRFLKRKIRLKFGENFLADLIFYFWQYQPDMFEWGHEPCAIKLYDMNGKKIYTLEFPSYARRDRYYDWIMEEWNSMLNKFAMGK